MVAGTAVITENSNSDVVMMKSAQQRQRQDVTEGLGLPELWGVLVQREMSPNLVIV